MRNRFLVSGGLFSALFGFFLVLGCAEKSSEGSGNAGNRVLQGNQILQNPEIQQSEDDALYELSLLSDDINYTQIEKEINSYLISEEISERTLTLISPRIQYKESQSDDVLSDAGDFGNSTTDEIGEGIKELKKRAPDELKELLEGFGADNVAWKIAGLLASSSSCVEQRKAIPTSISGDCLFFLNLEDNLRKSIQSGQVVEKTCRVDVSFTNCTLPDGTSISGDASFSLSLTLNANSPNTFAISVTLSNLTITTKNNVSVTFSKGELNISATGKRGEGGSSVLVVNILGAYKGKSFSIYSKDEFTKVAGGYLKKSHYADVSYQKDTTSPTIEIKVEKTKIVDKKQENTFSLGITDKVSFNDSIIKSRKIDLVVVRNTAEKSHSIRGTATIYKKYGRVITIEFSNVKLPGNCGRNPIGGSITATVKNSSGAVVVVVKTTFKETCSCLVDVEIQKDNASVSQSVDICDMRKKAREKEMEDMMMDDSHHHSGMM